MKGKVTEVCQMMGCWMSLADVASGKLIMIKVNDGDIVFPKDSIGKSLLPKANWSRSNLPANRRWRKPSTKPKSRDASSTPPQ